MFTTKAKNCKPASKVALYLGLPLLTLRFSLAVAAKKFC